MTDDSDELQPSWREAEKARRLLRQAQSDSSASDIISEAPDVSEIYSSLQREVEEVPGEGNLLKTVVETRGIRRTTRHIFRDAAETSAQEQLFGWTPEDTRSALFMAANRHLRAKGEIDYFGVFEAADVIAEQAGSEETTPEAISSQFDEFANDIENRTGRLSIETAAAKFIRAHDRLFMILNENPEMQAAASEFADAWHWLHMEWSGEHETAAIGAKQNRQGLQHRPEAARQKAAQRLDIIEVEYLKFVATETREHRHNSAGAAAEGMIENVRSVFMDKGLGKLSDTTLEKHLRGIIKKHRSSRG